ADRIFSGRNLDFERVDLSSLRLFGARLLSRFRVGALFLLARGLSGGFAGGRGLCFRRLLIACGLSSTTAFAGLTRVIRLFGRRCTRRPGPSRLAVLLVPEEFPIGSRIDGGCSVSDFDNLRRQPLDEIAIVRDEQ